MRSRCHPSVRIDSVPRFGSFDLSGSAQALTNLIAAMVAFRHICYNDAQNGLKSSSIMHYDFQTLSPDEFEALIADLFSAEWSSLLESYKPGKDSGIDLLHSRTINKKNKCILQCKRYPTLGFTQLKASFRNELPKLKNIQPVRYIIVTSVNLSLANKKKLMEDLYPWVKSTGDIYGQAELNTLLRKHDHIVRSHFKLWISSTVALEAVLHSRIFNLTHYTLEETKHQMCKLVLHDGYERTLQILNQKHHCIIAGNPGIGKTTLAKILLCHYVLQGFEPAVVHNDIGDAWALISRHQHTENHKIAILYDDFLGQTRYDQLKFGKNEDSHLIQLIRLAERSNNIRFILTSREYIISDARVSHGVFDTYADQISKCTINLGDYSKAHRAKVLFNHLYFSDLSHDKLRAIVSRKLYKTIIGHKHFNPRIIETISSKANSDSLSPSEFIDFITSKLDNPAEIWEGPFNNEIRPLSRWILAVLWTMNGKSDLKKLKRAVVALSESAFGAESAFDFRLCLRELADTFITSATYRHASGDEDIIEISFQNPSINDYMEAFLIAEPLWIESIASEALFSVQHMKIESIIGMLSGDEKLRAAAKLFNRRQLGAGEAKGDTYRNREGILVYTENDLYTKYDDVLVTLKISEHMIDSKEYPNHSLVTTTIGWDSQLQMAAETGAAPYSIRRMIEWLTRSKYWRRYEHEIKKAFYRSLMNCVHATPDWCEELSTINILHECTALMGIELSTLDKLKFQHDADCRATEVLDYEENVQILDDTADHLEQFHNRMKFGSKDLVLRLREKSDSLFAEDGSPEEGVDSAISQTGDTELDIDAMFFELVNQ